METLAVGVAAVFVSTIFASLKDILSKGLAVRIDGMTSTFSSFAFALPFYVIVLGVLFVLGHDLFAFSPVFWWLVAGRAITDVFAEGMKMYSFAHGDISLVTIIFSLSPLCVLALTPVFTNDSISFSGALAVVLVVLGSVALVFRPSHPDWRRQKKAIILAAGAAFFFGLNSIFDKLAMESHLVASQVVSEDAGPAGTEFLVRPTVGGFAMTAAAALLILPFVCFRKDRLMGLYAYQGGLHVRGFLEVAFMVCKLVAMQSALPAAYVVGLFRASLLFSILSGWLIFKERDVGRRILAGILIIAGVAWILWEQAG